MESRGGHPSEHRVMTEENIVRGRPHNRRPEIIALVETVGARTARQDRAAILARLGEHPLDPSIAVRVGERAVFGGLVIGMANPDCLGTPSEAAEKIIDDYAVQAAARTGEVLIYAVCENHAPPG